MFTYVYYHLIVYVYLCLLPFARVYQCLLVFTYVYPSVLLYTYLQRLDLQTHQQHTYYSNNKHYSHVMYH